MTIPNGFMTSDAEELEFEESLKGLDISFPVPDVSDSGEAVETAAWVESPRVMLETLTNELNAVLTECEARLFNDVVIQLKPEYLGESSNKQQDLIWMALKLSFVGKTVALVNVIQPTPFRAETAFELGKMIYHGNSLEFDRAISKYKSELVTLATWIKAKEILSGTVKQDDEAAEKRRSASLDDVKRAYDLLLERGDNPTKDRITEVLRNWGLTIGGSRANKLKREVEKQSAVRPPDCAD